MPEIPRVYVSLMIETDQAAEDVQLAVLASLSDRHKIVSSSVQGFNGEDDPTPEVAANDLAKHEGAVLVSWAADADYRGEVTV